ncbi:MAG: antibiotic biosynthesis monooxygenase [Rubricoccaceae bacterium]|nr:antibiotic biosynthesis monooxygenase [Rubricoccaceae bacterium]
MLIRTVRMTFRPDRLGDFLALFRASAPRIRAAPGCQHLALLEDARYPNILSTYSLWDDEAALDRYRHSELFLATWAKTKPLFAAPPAAHSHRMLIEVDPEA